MSLGKVSINRQIGSLILGKQHADQKQFNILAGLVSIVDTCSMGGLQTVKLSTVLLLHTLYYRFKTRPAGKDIRQLEQPEETNTVTCIAHIEITLNTLVKVTDSLTPNG